MSEYPNHPDDFNPRQLPAPDVNTPEGEDYAPEKDDPNKKMTREEWEKQAKEEEKAARKRRKTKKKINRKKLFLWIGIGLLVLIVIFIIGWIPRHERSKKAKQLAKQRENQLPQVEVVQARRSQVPGELTVPGTTSPLIIAYIYARANGYLKRLYVDIGDHVKKGQLLAIIDAPDLDQQVDQARQQLQQAQAQEQQQQAQLALNRVTWQRYKVLVDKGVFSRQDGDQQEAAYLAQQAVVASAQRNIDSYRANLQRLIALQSYERVTAPFDGVITQRNSDVGALVGASGSASPAPPSSSQTPSGGSASVGNANTSGTTGSSDQAATPSTEEGQGGPLFAIAQFDKLRILVSVPESYANSIHRGMSARVFIQEQPGKPIPGTVTRVADSIDQNTRTMLVEVDIDNRSGALYPGIYAIVTFVQVRGTSPIVIPGDAIVVRNDRTSVAVVKDQKIQIVPVEIGRDYGPSVEILTGLQVGDTVVLTVTDDVVAGRKVNPHLDQQAENQAAGQGGEQTNQVPNAGPSQYGDQSIVNSSTESTSQNSKQSQQKSGQQNSGQQKQSGGKKQ